MELADLRDPREPHPRRSRAQHRREARRARADPPGGALRRPRAARGLSRARQDTDRTLVRAGDLARVLAHPVHARPDALGCDGLVDLRPAYERVHVPGRPDLRQSSPQPTRSTAAPPKTQAALLEAMQERQVTTEGRDAAAATAVHRARDAEPDRVRGHLSAAGGAARPLPDADRRRLPEPRASRSSCSHGDSTAARTSSSSRPSSTRRRSSRMQRALEQVHGLGVDRGGYISRSRRGDARIPAGSRSARARAAASRC